MSRFTIPVSPTSWPEVFDAMLPMLQAYRRDWYSRQVTLIERVSARGTIPKSMRPRNRKVGGIAAVAITATQILATRNMLAEHNYVAHEDRRAFDAELIAKLATDSAQMVLAYIAYLSDPAVDKQTLSFRFSAAIIEFMTAQPDALQAIVALAGGDLWLAAQTRVLIAASFDDSSTVEALQAAQSAKLNAGRESAP